LPAADLDDLEELGQQPEFETRAMLENYHGYYTVWTFFH